MTELAWLILIAVSALALASMTVRGVTRYRGPELVAYIVAVAMVAVLGAVIAAAVDDTHTVLGGVIGVGVVEVAPTIGTAVRGLIRARAKRGEGE
jgi:hypothetical protein